MRSWIVVLVVLLATAPALGTAAEALQVEPGLANQEVDQALQLLQSTPHEQVRSLLPRIDRPGLSLFDLAKPLYVRRTPGGLELQFVERDVESEGATLYLGFARRAGELWLSSASIGIP